jgi:hypothetical protein
MSKRSGAGRLGRSALSFVAAAAILAGPRLAGAAPAPPPTTNSFGFSVEPYADPGAPARSALTFELAAGQSQTDRVEVRNPGDQARTFYLYAADAYSTSVGGAFALHLRTDASSDAAAWIALPAAQLTVPPRTASVVPIQLNVPADATPGDHTAGIVAEDIAPVASQGGVKAVHRVAARTYVRVEGPLRPALAVTGLAIHHDDPVLSPLTGLPSGTVSFTLVNSGNVRVQLDQIKLRLTGLFGRTVHTITLRPLRAGQTATPNALPDQILPRSAVQFSQDFRHLPPFEALDLHVAVAAEDPVVHTPVVTAVSRGLWIVPWAVLGLLVGAIALGWLLRRRRQSLSQRANEFPAAPLRQEPERSPVAP